MNFFCQAVVSLRRLASGFSCICMPSWRASAWCSWNADWSQGWKSIMKK